MRGGRRGSTICAARSRIVFKTVLVLIESTREQVADARTVHRHRHHKITDELNATLIGVTGDELPQTTMAPILLFLVGSCAILFNVSIGTTRTGDFFKAHTSKNSLSESLFKSA